MLRSKCKDDHDRTNGATVADREPLPIVRVTGDREVYFWNTQGGAELDLLTFTNGQRLSFEFKYADAPTVTRSLQVAREDLRLNRAFIIHPGRKSYPLNEWVEALSLPEARTRVQAMTTRAN
jgi:predicted AAA+ superfamily ATPase